ncbi:MAG TPA: TetR/AcrR family transcriptional regulator [Acidimicrobiia bacterium]|jgi:AcrR family transcriptional regulator
MSRAKTPAEHDADPAVVGGASDDRSDLPDWKRQSVERSLRTARQRAQEQSDRLVASAIELIVERGNTDFTVQDVVDHSRISIRTFYRFFASKDDLLIAVHHTIVEIEVVPRLEARCNEVTDPILRVRRYIEGVFDLVSHALPVARALTVYYYRLAESRPDDLEIAERPQLDLLVALLRAAPTRAGIDVEHAGVLIHRMLLGVVHMRILGSQSSAATSIDDVWQLCAYGLGLIDSTR